MIDTDSYYPNGGEASSMSSNMDMTEASSTVENAEVSFPSPEEIRTSYTSRSPNHTKKQIWNGSRRNQNGQHTSGNIYDMNKLNQNSNESNGKTLTKRRIYIASIIIAIIVLFVIIPATVSSGNKKDNSNDETSIDEGYNNYDGSDVDTEASPDYVEDNNITNERPSLDEIADFIVSNYISDENTIDNMDTPQALAIQWLQRDDPANLKVPPSYVGIQTYEGYMYMVRYIMAVHYYAFLGSEWEFSLHFLEYNDVCEWNDDFEHRDTIYRLGLFCTPQRFGGNSDTTSSEEGEDGEGEIVNVPFELHLESNNLSGMIPSEIGMLTTLQKLILTSNDKMTGEIPYEICRLTGLRSLHLSNNQLSGPIPDCISEMVNLQLLDLTGNKLNEQLPVTLCEAPVMNEIHLGSNEFIGPIPECFGSMPTVTQLVLHDNQLDGYIPTNLCQLPNLLNLDLGTNLLVGEIPTCLGNMTALQGLDLSDNTLIGTLPDEFNRLEQSLRILSLSDNELTGNPSDTLYALTKLRVLLAANNNFTFIMDAIMDYTFLQDSILLEHLDLSGNGGISGSFPLHLLSYPELISLDLSNNQLSGEFPEVINSNPTLKVLAVHNNLMSGPISGLNSFIELVHLDLSYNQFTGSIDSLGVLPRLKNLLLSNNPFDAGFIPFSFTELLLEELSLRNTSRTGTLVDPIMDKWVNMKFIDYGSNNLEGSVPSNYGSLPYLQYLILHDNDFLNGDLPETFMYANELAGIFLDGTSITAATSIELLCTLPKFDNVTIDEEVEPVFIVNCLYGCSGSCSGCICCDPTADASKCSTTYLESFDMKLDKTYRRTSNFYTISEEVQSTYEDQRRRN